MWNSSQHCELDKQIRHVTQSEDLTGARQDLGQLIQAVREHFEYEENLHFPLAEKVLAATNLVALGSAAGQKSPASNDLAGSSELSD